MMDYLFYTGLKVPINKELLAARLDRITEI